MKAQIIQPAKYAAGVSMKRVVEDDDGAPNVESHNTSVIWPAVISIDGIKLSSETPTSAAQAFKINAALEKIVEASK